MKRRTLLARVGVLGLAGFAGCTAEGGDDTTPTEETTEAAAGGADGTDTSTATPTDTHTKTPTETAMTPTLGETTIEVQNSDCGQQVSDATVTFDGDAVVVEGTIWAPDPSWTATVVDASYDGGADELAVTVGITEREDADGPVVQCIAEIDYRTTTTFTDGLPGTVTVTHETNEGTETVASADCK